jgi:hypothetical protein
LREETDKKLEIGLAGSRLPEGCDRPREWLNWGFVVSVSTEPLGSELRAEMLDEVSADRRETARIRADGDGTCVSARLVFPGMARRRSESVARLVGVT